MPRPKVTVILAVYKAEAFIEKCVRSLFNQTLDNLEYIFIDDCSPDNSIEIMERILEEYPNRKSQVKVIRHSANQGVGKTRQDGLDAASGEYIIHCDPDDWVDLTMYEDMYKKAKETRSEMVICDIMEETKYSSSIMSQKPEELTSKSVLESLTGLSKRSLHCSLCNKLILSSCLTDIEIPDGLDSYEDGFVNIKVLTKSIKISYLPMAMYHYRIDTDNSLTKIMSIHRMEIDRKVVHEVMSIDGLDLLNKRAFAALVLNRDVYSSCYSNWEFRHHYYNFRKFISYNKQIGGFKHKSFLYLSCIGFQRFCMFFINLKMKIRSILNRESNRN